MKKSISLREILIDLAFPASIIVSENVSGRVYDMVSEFLDDYYVDFYLYAAIRRSTDSSTIGDRE